jgi:hypothetical protein
MMASAPATVTIDRVSHPILRSRPLEFIFLFSLAATVALALTTRLAVAIAAGHPTELGWVNLNASGGILVGGVQGLIQYAALRSRYRISLVWIGVTAIGWAFAVGYDWQHLGLSLLFTQGLCSPIIFGLVGVVQGVFLLHQRQLRNSWLKVVSWQIAWVVALQLMTLLLAFVLAILTLATLGRDGTMLPILHAGAIAVYNCGLLAHGIIPAWGLYHLCCYD